MRISDWSSDVCSSDLDELTHAHGVHHRRHLPRVARQRLKAVEVLRQELAGELAGNAAVAEGNRVVLVAAEDRTSAGWGKGGPERVILGGGGTLKKKKKRARQSKT